MRRTWVAALAGILLLTVALAGCSGSSKSNASGGVAAGAPGAASAARPGDARAPVDTAAADVQPRSLIRTAQLQVQVRDVTAAANSALGIVGAAGGSADSDDRTGGPSPSAELALRVPPAKLTSTIERLAALGTETSQQSSTRDVTGQVADVSSRAASAQASIARLRTLFARATKVSDIIAIEDELAQREADLESLQAQQRALDSQTVMATVTLYLTRLAAPARAKHHAATGFLGGLAAGWRAFTGTAAACATAVGAALPFLVLLALLGGAGGYGYRRSRAASGPPAPNAPADSA
ncbi:MAG: DUF4349 domain-containing protein [Jatrophihabitantaceae bacterium]